MTEPISPEEVRRQRRREAVRRYLERNREKINATRRARRAQYSEYDRKYKAANRERINAERRARYAANLEDSRARNRIKNAKERHGSDALTVHAAMWEAQGGKCYLCGIYLVPEAAVVDHDHRCCPRNRSCQFCRRGLACDFCNNIVGFAHDDPAVLRVIADSLEAKLAEVNERLAQKPAQLSLIGGES